MRSFWFGRSWFSCSWCFWNFINCIHLNSIFEFDTSIFNSSLETVQTVVAGFWTDSFMPAVNFFVSSNSAISFFFSIAILLISVFFAWIFKWFLLVKFNNFGIIRMLSMRRRRFCHPWTTKRNFWTVYLSTFGLSAFILLDCTSFHFETYCLVSKGLTIFFFFINILVCFCRIFLVQIVDFIIIIFVDFWLVDIKSLVSSEWFQALLPQEINLYTQCTFYSRAQRFFPLIQVLKLRKVIKDIKNINTFDNTTTQGLDFGWEKFYRNHHMTP